MVVWKGVVSVVERGERGEGALVEALLGFSADLDYSFASCSMVRMGKGNEALSLLTRIRFCPEAGGMWVVDRAGGGGEGERKEKPRRSRCSEYWMSESSWSQVEGQSDFDFWP